MGSDYQRIKISAVTGGRIVLEVTEVHPDMAAIGWLLTGTRSDAGPDTPLTPRPVPAAMAARARTFAAQLLSEYGDSDFKAAAVRRSHEDEDGHQADTFVADLVVLTLEPLTRANGRGWLYRAALAIDLVDPSLARGFEVGDGYVARACPNGEWHLE